MQLDRGMPYGVGLRQFFRDLASEIRQDNVTNGAAALGYYWMLAIFPAMIALLSVLPYLPIPNLQQGIMQLLQQGLPGDTAKMFTGTVQQIVSQRNGGLLSFGLLFTIWAASSGMYAVMQQLNITYDVVEGRGFFKVRVTAILLTLLVGLLIIVSFGMIVLGGRIEGWIGQAIGQARNPALLWVFGVVRWLIIALGMLFAFAVTYYFAPDVEQKFRFITPGSVMGVVLLVAASLGFRYYVGHFGSYSKTYGSIGAVIVLMAWLDIMGLVLLLGSEVNALLEHYHPEGKAKGEKKEPKPEERAA